MAKPGPKPKTNHLKVLQGVENKQRLNDNEPTPPPNKPARPDWITGYAKTVWERLATPLHEMGVLTYVDRDTFAAMCILVEKLREAYRNDDAAKIPKLAQQLRIMAAEFACTPSGRAGITLPNTGGDKQSKKGSRLLG